ncbi:MAG: FAD-dependent oxidoreductase, partial [Acidovorax sp.]|uniref:FAD-dependent oxidoreductase n=1 Tax=Acidovorax sp. TaxID=1872122 RepID=UPI0039E503E3
HARAGWLRPARLAAALLAQPGIAWRGGCAVDQLTPTPHGWQALDATGQVLAQAPIAVIAGGHASARLLAPHASWPDRLNPLRGQLSCGEQPASAALPPFPVNGHGSLIAHVPLGGGHSAWYAGATFERDQTAPPSPAEQAQAQATNAAKLAELLPAAAAALAGGFTGPTWNGVRCTTPDRLPIVGSVQPDLWISTAMGARGLTLALLCGELLAARLEAEPLPLEPKLARALGSERFLSR